MPGETGINQPSGIIKSKILRRAVLFNLAKSFFLCLKKLSSLINNEVVLNIKEDGNDATGFLLNAAKDNTIEERATKHIDMDKYKTFFLRHQSNVLTNKFGGKWGLALG